MSAPESPFIWRSLRFQRPLDPRRVADALRQWAADGRSPRIVLETRLTPTGVTNLVGWPRQTSGADVALRTIPDMQLLPPPESRPLVNVVSSLRASTRHRPLRTDDPESIVRALLAMSIRLQSSEAIVLQLILGPGRIPLAIPTNSPSSIVMPWWQVAWMGNGGTVDGDKRTALRAKVNDHGFACLLRIGVGAASKERRRTLMLGMLAAIRTCEAPGVRLRLRAERPARLRDVQPPLLGWPLRLGIAELVGLTAWPLGDADLPGQPPSHPRILLPPPGTTGDDRVIASSPAGKTLALPIKQALHHLHVVGPTGTGKSTLLANLILNDIVAGRGVVVIEPKGDLVDDVLARLPREHHDRVVVLDPADPAPVGLNPLHGFGQRPELVADGMVAVFKQLYGSSIGARSADIIYAGVLTLCRRPDASLVMLPLLYTNPGFRRSLVAGLSDPLVLQPFWATFESWSEAERAAAVAPVQNKLRPLLRPGIRAVLGQREPRFELSQVFTDRTVLLVPLRRGLIGPEAASLLGSLVVAQLWHAIQARAHVAPAKRHEVSIVIDELQDYLHLPTDLGEALAQARGYGVAFTLAHQFMSQLPRTTQAAVLANARSRVAFQLPHKDAVQLQQGHPELAPIDFETLGQFNVYASLFARGQSQPYASGQTLALPPAIARAADIRAISRRRYGRPLDEIEAGFADLLNAPLDDLGPTGRRRRVP